MTDLRDEHLIPADSRPGHHPDHEQDKPDLAAFRQRAANPIAAAIGDAPDAESTDRVAATTPIFPQERGIFGTVGYAALGLGSKAVHAVAGRL